MTLDELVEAAWARLANTGGDYLASAILDLLAEADPCGYEAPSTELFAGAHCVFVPETWAGPATPDDARALARALFRRADEADEENEKRAIRAALALNKSNAPVE